MDTSSVTFEKLVICKHLPISLLEIWNKWTETRFTVNFLLPNPDMMFTLSVQLPAMWWAYSNVCLPWL